MRHNGTLRSVAVVLAPAARTWRQPLAAALLALVATACQRPHPDADAQPLGTGARATLQWNGTRPCVDCRGIDVQLTLARDDDYALTETFHTRAGASRFVEHGCWQRQGVRLRLQGDTGSLRIYRLLPDGRLQPRDLHGCAFASASTLQPVAGVAP
jgi:hypothetical protein